MRLICLFLFVILLWFCWVAWLGALACFASSFLSLLFVSLFLVVLYLYILLSFLWTVLLTAMLTGSIHLLTYFRFWLYLNHLNLVGYSGNHTSNVKHTPWIYIPKSYVKALSFYFIMDGCSCVSYSSLMSMSALTWKLNGLCIFYNKNN